MRTIPCSLTTDGSCGAPNSSLMQAQALARALNALTKSSQFSYTKARAAARKDENVDWTRTKIHNEGFNADVDGCESFIMRDGSVCHWKPGAFTYVALAK